MRGSRTLTKVFTRSDSQGNAFFRTSGCSSDPTCNESMMLSRLPPATLYSLTVPPSPSLATPPARDHVVLPPPLLRQHGDPLPWCLWCRERHRQSQADCPPCSQNAAA